jgi:hypothetical protein
MPPPIAERMKNTGNMEEYQSGCNRVGVTRKSEPSEEWCRLDSEMPVTTTPNAIRWSQRMIFSVRKRSMMVGANSMAVTVKYRRTHQNTSNKKECSFHIKIGCQNRCGRPMSNSNAVTEHP